MHRKKRNSFKYNGWAIKPLEEYETTSSFDCGRDDLNEFFQIDLSAHEQQLLTKTYSVTPAGIRSKTFPIIALISFCNDKIYLDSVKKRIEIPENKPYSKKSSLCLIICSMVLS
jgi:hypothetical protein